MQIDGIMNTYNRKPIIFQKGKGIWLYDKEGTAYMDFVSGVAVNCLGHSHHAVIEGIKQQVENLMHVSNLYWTDEQITLGKALCLKSDLSSVFFCNSGTESLETAFKISRKYGLSKSETKSKIVVMENAFHGRTVGALSLTANTKYKVPFGSLINEIVQVPINNKDALSEVIDDSVCAVFIEPIQGEGGIYTANHDYLQCARNLTDVHDALLVFDEVQCGIGRTGKMFAFQDSGIIPDVLCLAKGLGGGMPLGATVVNKRADVLKPGDHGSTFGGNPLACKVGNTVLEIVGSESFLSHVEEASNQLVKGLSYLDEQYSYMVEVRGRGLMLGIETKFKATDVIEEALKQKLLLIGAGENTIRIIPPLNINSEEIELFLVKFENALKKLLIK